MPLRPRRRRPPRPGALLDFSPTRIARQILILQLLYYITASILLVFTALVAGAPVSLDLVLDWRNVRGDTTDGWMIAGVWMLNSFVTTIPIAVFIARSKLVTDFALTIHGLHFLFVALYTHTLAITPFWWLVQAASSGLMISLGMWACRWRELKPISFGGSATGSTTTRGARGQNGGGWQADAAVAGSGGDIGDEEEALGYTRGAGRKARDALGGYEMVEMREEKDENG